MKKIVQGSQSHEFLVCNIVVQIQTQISVLETLVWNTSIHSIMDAS